MERLNGNSSERFESIFLNALNIYVPLKMKILRFNNSAFMTKKLREVWKDQNEKITLIRIEIMKTGANMKTKETAALIFSENQKSNI